MKMENKLNSEINLEEKIKLQFLLKMQIKNIFNNFQL